MGGYVVNFSVYTMAMIGLICFAVFVYKKVMDGSIGKKHTKFIEIEDTLNLNPRKTLHVIRAGNEKFLIASDIDRTSLISKLNDNSSEQQKYNQTYREAIENKNLSTQQMFKDTLDYVAQKTENSQTAQRVHLEPIRRKHDSGVGISGIRKSLDTRAGAIENMTRTHRPQRQVSKVEQTNRTTQQSVKPQQNIQPKKLQQSTTSATITMRDMAKKINEL